MNLSKLLQTPSVKASGYYAASGVCFAIATLLFARVFAPSDFGVVALAIALTNVGIAMGSAGMSGTLLRNDILTDRLLLNCALAVTTTVALLLGTLGWRTYGIEGLVLLAIVVAVSAGGMALLGLVPFQKAHRFGISVPLSQVGNMALLLSAGVLLILPAARVVWLPTAGIAVAFGAVAIWAWWDQLRQGAGGVSVSGRHGHDAVQFTLFSAADAVMWQLERLLIPVLLSIEELAVFAVIGAIAIAPYHVLAASAGATLIPRLKAEPSGKRRRALMFHEARVMLSLAALGGVIIVLLTPPLLQWYLGPKIVVTHALLVAAVAGGVTRIFAVIARAPAVAFGTSFELRRVSAGAWIAVLIGVGAAWTLADLGLVGMIVGVAVGWLARAGFALKFTWHHVAAEKKGSDG